MCLAGFAVSADTSLIGDHVREETMQVWMLWGECIQ